MAQPQIVNLPGKHRNRPSIPGVQTSAGAINFSNLQVCQDAYCGECLVNKDDLDHKLRLCGKCKRQAYCSRVCQLAHWSQHKRLCKDANEADKLMNSSAISIIQVIAQGGNRLLIYPDKSHEMIVTNDVPAPGTFIVIHHSPSSLTVIHHISL